MPKSKTEASCGTQNKLSGPSTSFRQFYTSKLPCIRKAEQALKLMTPSADGPPPYHHQSCPQFYSTSHGSGAFRHMSYGNPTMNYRSGLHGYIHISSRCEVNLPFSDFTDANPDQRHAMFEAVRLGMMGKHEYKPNPLLSKALAEAPIPVPLPPPEKEEQKNCEETKIAMEKKLVVMGDPGNDYKENPEAEDNALKCLCCSAMPGPKLEVKNIFFDPGHTALCISCLYSHYGAAATDMWYNSKNA